MKRIILLLLTGMLFLAFNPQPVAGDYEKVLLDGQWNIAHTELTERSWFAYGYGEKDTWYGKIGVFTCSGESGSAKMTGVVGAKFQYTGESRTNHVLFKYHIKGGLSFVDVGKIAILHTAGVVVSVSVWDVTNAEHECEDVDRDLSKIIYASWFGVDYWSINQTRFHLLECYLGKNRMYEVRLEVCTWSASFGTATVSTSDFKNDQLGNEIDLEQVKIWHTDVETTTSGGNEKGVQIYGHYSQRQYEYNDANELHFTSENSDSNIRGWEITISKFNSSNSTKVGKRAVNVNVYNPPELIHKDNTVEIDVIQWLKEGNYMGLKDVWWKNANTEAQGQAQMQTQVKAIPDHHWRVGYAVAVPEGYKHTFTLANDDDTYTLKVVGLSFLPTMEDYNDLCKISFLHGTAPIDLPPLGPAESWVADIITDDPLIGGHIYFQYDMYDPTGEEVVCNARGGHPVVLPTVASLCFPADEAGDVPTAVALRWTPGKDANTHDVYFGTSFTDVNNANTSDPNVYKGNQDTNSYGSLSLELGTTYYWRIDEVNDPHPNSPWKGDIWSFTTTNFVVVDNFDSYADNNALYAVWKDYWADTTSKNGAEVFVETDPNFTRDANSMRYYYVNNDGHKVGGKYVGSWAEALASDLQAGTDWTIGGVKALTLYFLGDVNNLEDTTGVFNGIHQDQMYVALADGNNNEGLVKYPDMNDIKENWWHEWNIDLQDFNDAGVVLTDVLKVYIGFGGTWVGQTKCGAGCGTFIGDTVYFEDIRLYLPRCAPEFALGDVSGDCFVDYEDIQAMSDVWLGTDKELYVEPPNDVNLLVEYLFDPCAIIYDSSGNEYHGIPVNEPNVHEGILTLDGNGFVDVPLGPNNPFDGSGDFSILISFRTTDRGVLISSARDADPNHHSMALGVESLEQPNRGVLIYGNCNVGAAGVGGDCLDNKWHNVVSTYEAQTFLHTVYLDGELGWVKYFDPNIPNIGDDTVRIGGSLNTQFPYKLGVGNFIGDIDNVRIYDYAMTHGEVLYLMGQPEGTFYVPLETLANLVPKDPPGAPFDLGNIDIINFEDYVVLANNWLKEFLWPEP